MPKYLKYPLINHSAFSEYTSESCYWAGFLAADGNIRITHHGSKQIRLYLKKSDSDHLEKFKTFLGSGHKVSLSPTYDRCSFEFTSVQIYDDLMKLYKLTPRKSMTLEPPENIPEDMKKHFIRGYFDGDGCLCETFLNKNSLKSSIMVTIVSTKAFVDWLTLYAQSLFGEIRYKPSLHPNGETMVFNLGTLKAIEFLRNLYEDSSVETRLDRKYEKFEPISRGVRKTRELIPYDQRMVCKTDRRRKPKMME